MIKPIETEYKGYRFRSRLEARWAIALDTMGLKWHYEHEGFAIDGLGWYLPDFWLPDLKCWAEVKPGAFTKEEFAKAAALPGGCLLLDGMPETRRGYYYTGIDGASYADYLKGNNFGRVLLSTSAIKHRLWFLLGESPRDYWLDEAPATAARQARFGERHTP